MVVGIPLVLAGSHPGPVPLLLWGDSIPVQLLTQQSPARRHEVVAVLTERVPGRLSAELGFTPARNRPNDLFLWFVTALLYGTRIYRCAYLFRVCPSRGRHAGEDPQDRMGPPIGRDYCWWRWQVCPMRECCGTARGASTATGQRQT